MGSASLANFFRRFRNHIGCAEFVYELHESFVAVALNLLHRGLLFTEQGKHPNLIERLFFADFAECEAHVDQHPLAGLRRIVYKQAEVDVAAYTDHFDQSLAEFAGKQFDDFGRYG